jgi:AcrR family transcriptional regulator
VPRKTGRTGENTRERILEAALPLFAQYGYAGASTRRLASAAGVNVATLAYYFEGKEGLYNAVVQRLHEDLAEQIPAEMPALPPRELSAWLAETAWEFVCDHRVHIRLLIRNVLDSGGHADIVMDRWTGPLMDRAEEIVMLLRPEWDRVRRRLLVLSLMHVVVRFALEDPGQFHAMAGAPDDLDEAVRSWITEMIRVLLGVV